MCSLTGSNLKRRDAILSYSANELRAHAEECFCHPNLSNAFPQSTLRPSLDNGAGVLLVPWGTTPEAWPPECFL